MAESPLPYSLSTYTVSDGYCCRYRRYPAIPSSRTDFKSVPQAHVVGIHGIQSHGGWYEHSCIRLSQAGFTVSFLDRRGSGLNEQDRGDAPSFRRLLDDLAEFLRALSPVGQVSNLPLSPGAGWKPAPQRSALPVFLVGISWGGKLAVALQRRHPGLVDGLVLLCPGFFAKVRPSRRQRLAIIWSRLVAPRRLFPIPLNNPDLFTGTPRWQRFLREDLLSLREATARLLIESVRLDGYLRFVPRYVRVPVLVMLAEHDRIIDNARTRRFVARFAAADKQIIEYPGTHHTLEFEPDPEIFLRDLINWLEKHCPQAVG